MAKNTVTIEALLPGQVGLKSTIGNFRGTDLAGSAIVRKAAASKRGQATIDHATIIAAGREALSKATIDDKPVRVQATDAEVLDFIMNHRLVAACHVAAKARKVTNEAGERVAAPVKLSIATNHQVGGKNPRGQMVVSVVG